MPIKKSRRPRALIEVEYVLVIDGEPVLRGTSLECREEALRRGLTALYAVPDADGGTLHVTVPED
jgi:hypothetical protein